MNPDAENPSVPKEVYHAAEVEFLQTSPSYYDEIKRMIKSRNDTDLEKYVKPIFKHLAKDIGAREDLPVWPLTPFKHSLLMACDINNDMRESAFEGLVEYIQSEHQKFLGTWNIHQLNTRSPAENFRALDQAFRAEYVGGAVSDFCDALEDYRKMYDESKHYGKVITIVQSSGMGKSRAVAEAGKDHYVLSVCFRDIRNLEYDPNNGWPPHDVSACQFFVEDVHNLNDPNFSPKGEEMAGAFLGALLEVVGEDLPNRTSPEEFSQAWRSEAPNSTPSTLSSRQAHFERIRDLAKRQLLRHADVLNKNRNLMPAVKKTASPRPVDHPSYREEMIKRAYWYRSVYDTLVKDHAQRIMERLEKKHPGEKKSFILAFDECAELNLTTPHWDPQDKMTLLALRRILKAGEDHDIWYVLLDTTSGIEHIIPVTGELAASFRLRTGLSPLHPYTYIYFNVMLGRLEKTPATPIRTLHLDFLQHFGRPYWYTLPSSEVLVMAQLKLLGQEDFHTTDVNQVLAVFSARLMLELGTGQTATRLAINGVRRHMRVLESVSATGFVNTLVPSEPILAIAAGALLTNSTSRYKKAVDRLVKEIILKEEVLERGRLGELLARIILMMARDFAIAPSKDNSDRRRFVQEDESEQFVCPVRLDAFLQALLGENLSVDGVAFPYLHRHCQKLLAWAHPQFVNFTHFMQVEKNIDDLSPEFLMPYWCRGAALVCAYGQSVIDMLIPTYSGDLDAPFELDKLRVVAVQVKIKDVAAGTSLVNGLTCPPLREEGIADRKLEHLVLLMDLGTKTPFKNPKDQMCNVGYKAAKRPPKSKVPFYLDQESNRFFINVRGHSAEQYPCIQDTVLDEAFTKDLSPHPPEFQKQALNMEESLKRLEFGPPQSDQ